MSVVLLSGGLDSTVLLEKVLEQESHTEVKAISFNYNQRHAVELGYVSRICAHYDIDSVVVNIGDALRPVFSGAKTSQLKTLSAVPVPVGRWDAPEQKATVVPNRNMIMLSIAMAHAMVIGAKEVWVGAHEGDYRIYPDCRGDFINAMDEAFTVVTESVTSHLRAPFLNYTKGGMLKLSHRPAKWLSENTWSCYVGSAVHCGQCGACQERKAAFAEAGLEDSTVYAD